MSESGLGITILPQKPENEIKPGLEFYVPERLPDAAGQRIAIITDFPHTEDLKKGRWLAGDVGEVLFNQFRHYGLDQKSMFLGALTRRQPDNVRMSLEGGIFLEDNNLLASRLAKYSPNLVVLVGEAVLRAALNKPGKKGLNEAKLINWRGSIFKSTKPIFQGLKCMAMDHPFEVCRQWGDLYPLFAMDVKRAAQECTFPEIRRLQREYEIKLSLDQIIERFEQMCHMEEVSMDIEGYVDALDCISFAYSPTKAFILPWASLNDSDRSKVFPHLAKFLRSRCKKVLQNSQYDNFVLTFTYGCFIAHVKHDTMMGSWEILPELPRSLATQVSIHTDVPYYKDDRESELVDTKHNYCCTDSAVTKELAEYQRRQLAGLPGPRRHFYFNVALLPAIMYLEIRGIHYLSQKAESLCAQTKLELAQLNKDMEKIINLPRERMLEDAKSKQNLDPRRIPAYETFNPASSPQCIKVLYDTFRYPRQFSRPTKAKPTPTVTADTPALLELVKDYNGPDHIFLQKLLSYRHLEEKRKALEWQVDPDGRMRASYDACGTVTGRFSCKKSPTGSGANLQTATSKLRFLFRADADCDFFQCDLSGADVWTVAAHCKALGDSTMFDDIMFGLKPAKLVALMYKYGDISSFDRPALAKMSKEITDKGPEGWLYFACKIVVHGTNYGLGLDTMAMQILKSSHKKMGRAIVTKKEDNKRLQGLYRIRYPGVKKWHDQCKDQLARTGRLRMCNGHERRFFGRKSEHSTFREWASTEPQANTTYVTNKALLQLWTDPENRKKYNPLPYVDTLSRRRVPFHVEPLHQVHDANCGQWHKSIREWAIKKVRSWFENPITVAGITFTIPFEGAWGPSWGELGYDKEGRWEGGEI